MVDTAKPAGSGDYVVQQGECLASIARAHGFLPETLWDHPDNSQLKQERKDPYCLLPGDRLAIPEPRQRPESSADKQMHSFRRKGLPAKLSLRIVKDGEPRKNVPYTLDIDGALSNGNTDGDGMVKLSLPPDAKQGRLIVGEKEDDRQVFELKLSGLDPMDSISGVQQRLSNLGYPCEVTGELDDQTRWALGDFQRAFDLEATGEPDQKTTEKLGEEHGG